MKFNRRPAWQSVAQVNRRLVLMVLLVILGTGMVWAQSTGTFTATGNMTTARNGYTATLLPNGKVLIAGGAQRTAAGFYNYLASAELYDPSTGTFTATGDMTTARFSATATLLADGRVLIAHDPNGPSPTAELYDPVTGTFSATGDRITPWGGLPTTTLLPDGRVLLAGWGAELYDPVSGTFSLTGAMRSAGGDDPTATLLTNGKVLLAGGYWELGPLGNAGAEVYDPSTGTFTATGNMTTPRFSHTATLLPDGTVLIAGGYDGNAGLASAELYDPATGTFSATGDMTTGRQSHTATLLPDGTVLIAGGGLPGSPAPYASAELYTPPLLQAAPVLFSLSDDGQGQGAILHAGTAQFASSTNPAIVGEALEIYCTDLVDGSVVPPQVIIGGRMAEVLYFGNTPGFVGLNQVNVRVPSGVAPGDAVPVRLTYLGRISNQVTIAVR